MQPEDCTKLRVGWKKNASSTTTEEDLTTTATTTTMKTTTMKTTTKKTATPSWARSWDSKDNDDNMDDEDDHHIYKTKTCDDVVASFSVRSCPISGGHSKITYAQGIA